MARIFMGGMPIERTEKPIIALLMGVDCGCYETNDSYAQALTQAGADVVHLGFENIYDLLTKLHPDGVVLPGGCFPTPSRFYSGEEDIGEAPNLRTEAYFEMLRYAKENKIPTLGICAGMQMLACTEGAKLIKPIDGHRLLDVDHAHYIKLLPGSLLSEVCGPRDFLVNSRHREAVDAENLGDLLKISAMSPDGIVEAIELKHPWNEFVLGTQFHPENLANKEFPEAKKLFKAFIEAAKKH